MQCCFNVRASLRILLVVTVCVSMATSAPTSKHQLREVIRCPDMHRSDVCYTCALLHRDALNEVYNRCCSGERELVDYCRSAYTTPPRRGGPPANYVW